MTQPIIVGVLLVYTGLLFAIAYWAESRGDATRLSNRSPLVYGLSFAVYCTSWTFYGAVGTAETRGWEFLPIYLGPALAFSVGLPAMRRLVVAGKRFNSTSIADFLSAHYQKSRAVAATVTVIAVIGAAPYIALQLKSVATTFAFFAPEPRNADGAAGVFAVAIVLAAFAISFGARHVDATRHNRGMIAAIAFDYVKLLAFVAVGAFALALLNGGSDAAPEISVLGTAPDTDRFLTLTLLSAAAVFCLPRQFHVTVVEGASKEALVPASMVFIFYLLVVSAFVAPIADAGLSAAALDDVPGDLHVLALPMAAGAEWLSVFAFVGGFAAATGMVIVATLALSTMIANELVAPFLLGGGTRGEDRAIGRRFLLVRRIAIGVVLLLAALLATAAPEGAQLASLGILSFAAVAQFFPPLIAALYWPNASRNGAIIGMVAGFLIWFAFLFAPTFIGVAQPVEGIISGFDAYHLDELTIGAALSLIVNAGALIGVSAFEARAGRNTRTGAATGGDRTVSAGDLYGLVEQCLGAQAACLALEAFEHGRGRNFNPDRVADAALIDFADRQMSKAIGASSSSILLRSALAGGSLAIDDVATLLGETTGKVSFSQELLQTALENTSHGVSVIDAELNLVAWNSAYTELFGYPDQLVQTGRSVEDLIRFNADRGLCGPGNVEEHVRRRTENLKKGRRHSHERTRPDGRVIRIEGVPSPSGAYVTTFTDVTEYRNIEKALRDSQRSIRFYTDNIPSMVAFADAEERLCFANSAYRRAYSVDEAAIGKTFMRDYLSTEDYVARKPHIEAALAGRRATFDIETAGEDGPQYMQVAYVPQFRADGGVRGFFGLYQDVTARRAAEIALAETNETLEERVGERTRELSDANAALDAARRQAEEATASKTRFLAAASHDVLQPLNAARLFASALKDPRDAADGRELAGKIDAAIASADGLLRSLLNISKLDAGGVTPDIGPVRLADIFEALKTAFEVAAEEKGLRLHVAPTSLYVESDRGLLTSALQNLVANAVRYTDEGRVLIGARRVNGDVRIDVRDTGRGVPERKRKEIFQEFSRLERDADTGGAGLGLATVDRIARLLGHEIGLQSTEGAGSIFSLRAPRAEPPASDIQQDTQPQRALRPARSGLEGLTAICIDNDAAVREAMTAALSRWGVSVQAFASDVDAVEAQSPGAPPPDFLLLDYQLDHGRTGFDALDALEARWDARPVTIMITASSSGDAEAEAATRGVPIVAKPIEPAELRALIAQLRRAAAE
ncbi:MAG: PAS-domain containing protein [Pseudomonadota bacterium]